MILGLLRDCDDGRTPARAVFGTQLANQPEENVVRAVIVDESLLKNIGK